MAPPDTARGNAVTLHLTVTDVDGRVRAGAGHGGARSTESPRTTRRSAGWRRFHDPFGHRWFLYAPRPVGASASVLVGCPAAQRDEAPNRQQHERADDGQEHGSEGGTRLSSAGSACGRRTVPGAAVEPSSPVLARKANDPLTGWPSSDVTR